MRVSQCQEANDVHDVAEEANGVADTETVAVAVVDWAKRLLGWVNRATQCQHNTTFGRIEREVLDTTIEKKINRIGSITSAYAVLKHKNPVSRSHEDRSFTSKRRCCFNEAPPLSSLVLEYDERRIAPTVTPCASKEDSHAIS